MAEVACFCGCLFSFDGRAGVCPRCGKVAGVTMGPAPRPRRSGREAAMPVMEENGYNAHRPAGMIQGQSP
jgi:hypothetical protein